jgi:hypothetical protein
LVYRFGLVYIVYRYFERGNTCPITNDPDLRSLLRQTKTKIDNMDKMEYQESGSNRPHSPILDTPPETRSPTSPINSDEHLPTPTTHVLPQYSPSPGTESITPEDTKGPYLGPNLQVKASGSPLLHQTEQMGRERLSPTRSHGFRDQQQQQQPNQFTPAFYNGSEKDDGFATSSTGAQNGGAGAQPRRFYANTTPTSYTMPGAHPLTRSISDSGKAEAPTRQGFYDSPAYWLILYFFFNLGLTLFNKIVLVSFPFPYVCSAFLP